MYPGSHEYPEIIDSSDALFPPSCPCPPQSFTPLFVLLDVFPSEKVIVSREILSGAYPTSAYFVSRVMAELPGQCILTGRPLHCL